MSQAFSKNAQLDFAFENVTQNQILITVEWRRGKIASWQAEERLLSAACIIEEEINERH